MCKDPISQPYPSKHNLESQSATELEVLRSSLACKVIFVRHYEDYQVGYMREGESREVKG